MVRKGKINSIVLGFSCRLKSCSRGKRSSFYAFSEVFSIISSGVLTSGDQRHFLHLPICCKEGFQEDENVFLLEKTLSSSCFLTFATIKVFWFFAQKTSKVGGKDTFKFYHLIRIAQQVCHLYRFLKEFQFFLSNSPGIFPRKPQMLNILRILTIPVALNGKIATIWSKNNFTFSSRSAVNSISKHWVKKTPELANLRGRVCSRISNTAQKYNHFFVYCFPPTCQFCITFQAINFRLQILDDEAPCFLTSVVNL